MSSPEGSGHSERRSVGGMQQYPHIPHFPHHSTHLAASQQMHPSQPTMRRPLAACSNAHAHASDGACHAAPAPAILHARTASRLGGGCHVCSM